MPKTQKATRELKTPKVIINDADSASSNATEDGGSARIDHARKRSIINQIAPKANRGTEGAPARCNPSIADESSADKAKVGECSQ